MTPEPSSLDLERKDRIVLAVLAAIGMAVWAWFGLSTRITLEDAFITFRYAGNLAQGKGFVYNTGERVLGTTTPLQTLLLAALGLALGPERIPTVASVLMPLFGLAAGLLAYAALVGLGIHRAGAAAGALLFYLHPLVIRTSLGGMETPLVLFLMALSLYYLSRQRSVAATITAAALALCRLDGLIWGGLVVGTTLVTRYRRPLAQTAGFIATIAPWVIFAFLYFGSPIPNTVRAKGVVRPGRERLLVQPQHVSRLSHWYLSGTGFASDHPLFPGWLALLGLGLYAAARSRRRETLLLAVFPPVYAVLMYLGRAPMYQWYLVPMLFCCLPLGGTGVGQVLTWVAYGRANWKWRAAAMAVAAAALVPGLMNLVKQLPRQARHARLFQENEWGLRRGLGLWLREHTPPNAGVAMEAIGYQGYFSGRRVIDMAGLVTPRVVKLKASTGSNGVLFKRIITELKPDYIVLRSFEVDQNRHFNGGKLFETPQDRDLFFRHYREARRFTAPHPELAPLVTHLTVYQRTEAPAGPFPSRERPWRDGWPQQRPGGSQPLAGKPGEPSPASARGGRA